MKKNKDEMLILRINKKDKQKLAGLAKLNNMTLSQWILSQSLSDISPIEIRNLYERFDHEAPSYVLAMLGDYLMKVPQNMWGIAAGYEPKIEDKIKIYVAAIIEEIAVRRKLPIPEWTTRVGSLCEPFFGSQLKNLRLYLLINSPIAFRKRNIFIDSGAGERV